MTDRSLCTQCPQFAPACRCIKTPPPPHPPPPNTTQRALIERHTEKIVSFLISDTLAHKAKLGVGGDLQGCLRCNRCKVLGCGRGSRQVGNLSGAATSILGCRLELLAATLHSVVTSKGIQTQYRDNSPAVVLSRLEALDESDTSTLCLPLPMPIL